MVSRRLYDLLYRRGAPWEGAARDELVELVTAGTLSAEALPRAIDLGCGSGANAIFLAQQGFSVVAVDFSTVALSKARAAAPPELDLQFVEADLLDPGLGDIQGPFDLLVDYGTLDDLPRRKRPVFASQVMRLSRPGSVFLLWCFYDEIPWWRRQGARFPGLHQGEVDALFGEAFDVVRREPPARGSGFACFLLTRR